MGVHGYSVILDEHEQIQARDRDDGADGVDLCFGLGTSVRVSPQQEIQLLAQLLGRARAMPRSVLEPSPPRIIGFPPSGARHAPPPKSAPEPEPEAPPVLHLRPRPPWRSDNLRPVGGPDNGDPAA